MRPVVVAALGFAPPGGAEVLDVMRRDDSTGRAARVLVWSLAQKEQRVGGERFYREMCRSYLRKVAVGLSDYATRRAWAAVGSILGWTEVDWRGAKSAGAKLRQIAFKTARWGKHLLLPEAALQGVRWALAHADVEGLLAGLFKKPTDAGDWKKVNGKTPRAPSPASGTRGKTTAVICPFHDDRHPSLILFANYGGESGGGWCAACGVRVAARFAGGIEVRATTPSGFRLHRDPRPVQPQYRTRRAGQIEPGRREAVTGGVLGDGLQGSRLRGTLYEVLRRAERRADWPSEQRKAWAASAYVALGRATDRQALPDRLYAVSDMVACAWSPLPNGGQRPTSWKAVAQRRIVFDFDDFDDIQGDYAEAMMRVLRRDPWLAGPAAVVQTSWEGIQVVADLADPEGDPEAFFADEEVIGWYQSLAQRLMRAAHRSGCKGGKVDLSAAAAGRWARRPGWRMKDGIPVRARLVAISSSEKSSRVQEKTGSE